MMETLQIAKEQLVTALELFLADQSPVSVQSLAGNAREILELFCRERGAEPFVDHVQREFPERRRAEIYGLINAYRNAFKHNDRNDDELLSEFDDTKNDHMLFIAIYDYEKAKGKMTIPMQIFWSWYCATYPQKLVLAKRYMAEQLAFLCILPRAEQKRRLLMFINDASKNPAIASHLMTET